MSDLLTSLLGSMTSGGALEALEEKSGGSADQISGLLGSALPQLMQAMGKNASSKEGAASLLGALAQHTSTDPVEKQIKEADEVDGGKILKHILGANQESVVSHLTDETGLTAKQVTTVLGNIAPALMSSVSGASKENKATKKATTKKSAGELDLSDGFDINDVMGILGMVSGNQSKKKGGLLGFLGSLLGK